MNKKRKIVIASLLKPVDDPRMYEKIALSMSQTNKYDINIIGFASKNIPHHPDIRFHPIFSFKRLSIRRVLSPLKYWQKILQLKPELIIVNTHDLLIVSCVYKTLFGSKIVYDVQENYMANIIWSSNLPKPLRTLLAFTVRLKEHLVKRMIIHFLVAERCYMNECSFISNTSTILENKARRKDMLLKRQNVDRPAGKDHEEPLKLIYSGTIAESYGIFDCLHLTDNLISSGKNLHLTIIGYCPRRDTLEKLVLQIKNKPYITLIGGHHPVPHQEILRELQKADFALISYRLNPSNKNCMPTRVWECLAYKVPMLMKQDHPWVPLLHKYKAGIALDFSHPQISALPDLPDNTFYPQAVPDSFYWEWEAKKLLKSMESLF